jgi:hypothetical protein
MRELSSNSHRIPTLRRIMGVMGIAWKVVIGLALVLPMTAYVVGSLVAVADEPPQHEPIIVEEQTQAPNPSRSPSDKPTEKPSDKNPDRGDDHGGDDDDETPEVITPSPSEFDDDDDDDNSGQGRGRGRGGDDGDDDNSGPGSDDD